MTIEETREYNRKYRKEYRKKNPDYVTKYNAAHREQIRANAKKYHDSPKGQLTIRRNYLKRKYGMDPSRYEEMLKQQGGICAICSGPPVGVKGKTGLLFSVDHNHTTGTVRALLCMPCNTMLGCAKENTDTLRRAISYLEKFHAGF